VPHPQTLSEDLACNDPEIEKNYKAGEPKLTLTAFDHDFLKRLSAKAAPSVDAWAFLNAPSIEEQISKGREAKGSELAKAAEALRRVEQRRYVVVFRRNQDAEGGRRQFDGGATAMIVWIWVGKTVCLAPESGSDVVSSSRTRPAER
jgi:hypothetical protein